MEINKDEALTNKMENGLHLYPVSPNESGIGLPYAPIDWPRLGDNWRWKVGKRVTSAGYFVDRYLYPPNRLKGRMFKSKLSVEQYVCTYPGTDVKAFFDSFSWKVPSRSVFKMKEDCKAGNQLCGSLIEPREPPFKTMFCDICCTVPGFCRDCCCILCSRTVGSAYEGYSFVRCEANVGDNLICGHTAHLECGLKSYMAGTVGGGINLDVEYYCRRCDARTDLLSHVTKLFETCESIDSIDDIKKLLDVGSRVLHGSQRSSAQSLLHQFQAAMEKHKTGTSLDDVQNVNGDPAVTEGMMSCKGNRAPESALPVEPVNIRQDPASKVSETFDPQLEAKKLDYEVDKVLRSLNQCQESEYNAAKEKLYEQRKYIQSLFQLLLKEKSEIARHTAYVADPEALLQLIDDRVEEIKREILKLKNMGQVANGSGNTSKHTLKEQFIFKM